MDYYVVSVTVGGVIYKTTPMSLGQAEMAVETFKLAAPNTEPQILFDHTGSNGWDKV